MGIASQQTQQPFPFPYDGVFRALHAIMPQCGFTIRYHDINLGRISASHGVSAFSWGENINLLVQPIDDNNTLVSIDSNLKLGINFAGAHRHNKNFLAIIASLSKCLQHWKQSGYFEQASTAKPGMYQT